MEAYYITVHHLGKDGVTTKGKHLIKAEHTGIAKRKILKDYKGVRVYAVSCVTMKKKTKTK